MGGRRTSKPELAQLEVLTREGLTCREIADKLGRSPAAIRNLRYKKHLVVRIQDETKALFHQRDELINVVRFLQGQKTSLASELKHLGNEKASLEAAIAAARSCLEETLAQRLISLKLQRPDLFTLSGPEQIAMLLKMLLK
jgi:predicted transcriptional regulator